MSVVLIHVRQKKKMPQYSSLERVASGKRTKRISCMDTFLLQDSPSKLHREAGWGGWVGGGTKASPAPGTLPHTMQQSCCSQLGSLLEHYLPIKTKKKTKKKNHNNNEERSLLTPHFSASTWETASIDPVFKWQARSDADSDQVMVPGELVTMVTLMVPLENRVSLCVCVCVCVCVPPCVFNMTEGMGCNHWLKRWVVIVR